MKITERLKVEHGIFLEQLKLLDRLMTAEAPAEILATAVETIAVAEARHTELEDRLLYPALRQVMGIDDPSLQAVAREHAEIGAMLARIRGGAADVAAVRQFVVTFRAHLEHEIHSLFALAEEWIPEERLVAMGDWDGEHVYDAVGKREAWIASQKREQQG
jgi:hemerythrin-like domain-containing protein